MFVTRITPDGTDLIYSTYFGGNEGESSETHSLFVDHLGQAYVACGTFSTDIPTTPGAIKTIKTDSMDVDGLFFKLSADGNELLACTYFGGDGIDSPEGLYVDSLQQLYVGGGSESDGLPITADAPQIQRAGGRDGFIVKLSPDFSTPEFCTYLGGTSDESVRAFHIAANGNIGVSGQTKSADFPTTSTAFQLNHTLPLNLEDSYLTIIGNARPVATNQVIVATDIILFPNPATDQITLRAEDSRLTSLEIYDLQGRLWLHQNFSPTTTYRQAINYLPAGVYLAYARNVTGAISRKRWVKW
jgi:hypothetical protein